MASTSTFSSAHLGSAHQVCNLYVLRSCASSIFTCFSFMSFRITSLHLSFGLPLFRCPPTSIFSLLHLLQSFSPHDLTISVSRLFIVSLMSCTCSYFFIPDFINPSTCPTKNVQTSEVQDIILNADDSSISSCVDRKHFQFNLCYVCVHLYCMYRCVFGRISDVTDYNSIISY